MSAICDLVQHNGMITELILLYNDSEIAENLRRKLNVALEANLAETKKPVISTRTQSTASGEIRRLDFSGCDLKEFAWNFDYTLLSELLLGNNQLTEIFYKLNLMKNLQILHLQHNQLEVLPSEVGGCMALQVLNVSHNRLTELPSSLGSLGALQILHVSHNQLTQLPTSLQSLTKLRILNADSNLLEEFPNITLGALESLDLDSNKLSTLPSTFGAMKVLRAVYLRKNQFRELPICIGKLERLSNLEIGGNRITNVPTQIMNKGTRAIVAHLQVPEGSTNLVSAAKLIFLGPTESDHRGLIESLFEEKESLSAALQSWKKKATKKKDEPREEQGDRPPHSLRVCDYIYDDITFNTWDFSGDSTVTQATFQFFSSKNSMYIIPFSVTSDDSVLDSWINSVAGHAVKSPIMLIAIDVDDKSLSKDYTTELLICLHNRYRERFPNIIAYMRGNLKSKKSTKEIRSQICQIVRQRGFTEHCVPVSYSSLLKKIESFKEYTRTNQQLPLITIRNLASMGKTISMNAQQTRDAASHFHEIGRAHV